MVEYQLTLVLLFCLNFMFRNWLSCLSA